MCDTDSQTNDENESAGNIKSAEEDEEKQTWTRREMEEAEPYPMPEVTDDDTEDDTEETQ